MKCDICHATIADRYVDGKTKVGPWANMCLRCHKTKGVGLGLGKGQMYDVKTGEQIKEGLK